MLDTTDNLTKKPGEHIENNRLVSLTALDTVVYPGTAGALHVIGVSKCDLFDWTCETVTVKKAHTLVAEVAAPIAPGQDLEVTPDGRIQPLAGGDFIGISLQEQLIPGCTACFCFMPGGAGAGAGGAAGNTSVLTANPDGSFTHDDGTGNLVVIPAPPTPPVHSPSELTANPDGSFTHDDGTGTTVTIPAPPVHTPSSYTSNPDGSCTLTDGNGGSKTIPNSIDVCTAVSNSDGTQTVTFTDRAGTDKIVTIPAPEAGKTFQNCSFNAVTGALTLNFLDADGITVTSEVCDLSALLVDVNINAAALDATGLILTITDTSGETFVINLSGLLSSYTDNTGTNGSGDGTIVLTNGDGTSVVTIPNSIDGCTSTTDPVSGDITITFALRDGTTIDKVIPGHVPSSLSFDAATGEFTHADGDGTSVVIPNSIDSCTSTTDATSGDITLAFTMRDGSVVNKVIPAGAISSLSFDAATGEFTHDDGTGTQLVIPNTIDSCTSTTDATSGDITLAFTMRDGTVVNKIIPAGAISSLSFDAASGQFTHDDGTGTQIVIPNTIDSCTSTIDGTTGDITLAFTMRDGSVVNKLIPADSASTLSYDDATGEFTHNAGDGSVDVVIKPVEICSADTSHGVRAEDNSLTLSGDCVEFPDCGAWPQPSATNVLEALVGVNSAGKAMHVPLQQLSTQLVNAVPGVADVAGANGLGYVADRSAYRVFVDNSAGDVDLTALSLTLANVIDTNEITFYATTATDAAGAGSILFTYGGLTLDYSILTLRFCVDTSSPIGDPGNLTEWYPT